MVGSSVWSSHSLNRAWVLWLWSNSSSLPPYTASVTHLSLQGDPSLCCHSGSPVIRSHLKQKRLNIKTFPSWSLNFSCRHAKHQLSGGSPSTATWSLLLDFLPTWLWLSSHSSWLVISRQTRLSHQHRAIGHSGVSPVPRPEHPPGNIWLQQALLSFHFPLQL